VESLADTRAARRGPHETQRRSRTLRGGQVFKVVMDGDGLAGEYLVGTAQAIMRRTPGRERL
jgi:hypothetical protein